MKPYRMRETGKLVDRAELAELFPRAVLANELTDDELDYFGADRVHEVSRPLLTETQTAEVDGAELQDGRWVWRWVVTDIPVDVMAEMIKDAKARKNAQINQWREEANFSTFPHAGKLIACDQLSRSDIDGVSGHISLFGTFPPDFPGAWKAKDNSLILMPDIEAFKSMYASMTAQGTVNFNHAQRLKAALVAANGLAEIDAIVW